MLPDQKNHVGNREQKKRKNMKQNTKSRATAYFKNKQNVQQNGKNVKWTESVAPIFPECNISSRCNFESLLVEEKRFFVQVQRLAHKNIGVIYSHWLKKKESMFKKNFLMKERMQFVGTEQKRTYDIILCHGICRTVLHKLRAKNGHIWEAKQSIRLQSPQMQIQMNHQKARKDFQSDGSHSNSKLKSLYLWINYEQTMSVQFTRFSGWLSDTAAEKRTYGSESISE